MLGLFEIRDRDLVRAPSTLDWLAIDGFRSGPALRRAEYNHRPPRSLQILGRAPGAGGTLNVTNLAKYFIECAGKTLVHQRRIFALDEMRIVAVAAQQLRQLLTADTR